MLCIVIFSEGVYMTKQDLKDYLGSYYDISMLLVALRSELDTRKRFDLECSELFLKIDECVSRLSSIRDTINLLDNPVLVSILKYKYICFKSFSFIASKLCYSERHVTRLHNQALLEILKCINSYK